MKHLLILSLLLIGLSISACNKAEEAANSNTNAGMAQPVTGENADATNLEGDTVGHTEETAPPAEDEEIQLEDDMNQPPPADDELEVTEEDTLGEPVDAQAPAAETPVAMEAQE